MKDVKLKIARKNKKDRISPGSQLYFTTLGGVLVRLKDIEINPRTMKLDVDIMELRGSFAIVVSEGMAKLTELPLHGETKIVTHQGKIKRVKWDEGEEF